MNLRNNIIAILTLTTIQVANAQVIGFSMEAESAEKKTRIVKEEVSASLKLQRQMSFGLGVSHMGGKKVVASKINEQIDRRWAAKHKKLIASAKGLLKPNSLSKTPERR